MYVLGMLFRNVCMVSYVSQPGTFPKPLSQEEEDEMVRRWEEGDEEARNILIEHNMRLVAHVVKKYQSSGMDADDLISIGTIGLIKAVNTYNSEKKIRIATYAARCIENEVLMVLRANKKLQSEVSLQEPIGFDREGNEVSLLDILDSTDEDITDKLDIKYRSKKLYDAMRACLRPREKRVIAMRYGLGGYEEGTQREIAGVLGISRSYVSRIEKKAITKLTEALRPIKN
ncbi:MAG: RNA polymerase sporulation sigma factor SigK [Ruminococcaceae bacterium]|nr:RNA polymerase sporulation sigma factor SigK [Oscillospiraceae bacterium]